MNVFGTLWVNKIFCVTVLVWYEVIGAKIVMHVR